MNNSIQYNGPEFLSSDFFKDPFSFYHTLQRENPVYWSSQINAWIVTRYDDVISGLRNPLFTADRGDSYFGQLCNKDKAELKPLQDFFSKWLLFSDGDFHFKLRKILGKSSFFNSNTQHKEFMKEKADSLLNELTQKDYGEIEIMNSYAIPLSITVISKIMGISEGNFKIIFDWTLNMISFMGSGKPDIDLGRKALASYYQLVEFVENLIEEGNYQLGESLVGDLIIYTREGELTKDELIATIGNILIDGYEPSALTLGHGILSLLKNHEQLTKLQQNRYLISGAIDETLRFENAFPYIARRSLEDNILLGREIKKNDRILFMVLAANRDPDMFKNPNEYNIERSNNSKHLAFGVGHHKCIGRNLAYTTIITGLESFLDRFKNCRVTVQEPEYRKSLGFRGFDKLFIRYDVI